MRGYDMKSGKGYRGGKKPPPKEGGWREDQVRALSAPRKFREDQVRTLYCADRPKPMSLFMTQLPQTSMYLVLLQQLAVLAQEHWNKVVPDVVGLRYPGNLSTVPLLHGDSSQVA